MTNFVSAYRVKYGQDPDILAGYGYDVVNIAAKAIDQAAKNGGVTPDNIKTALYAIKDYPGVTGKTSFDSNGDVLKELRMMQVKDGKFVPAQLPTN
jgi:branched-chain amino acid transport system substrate-binding protein